MKRKRQIQSQYKRLLQEYQDITDEMYADDAEPNRRPYLEGKIDKLENQLEVYRWILNKQEHENN